MTVNNVVVGSTHVADRELRARFRRRRRPPHCYGHDCRRDQRAARLHHQSAGADADERLAEPRYAGRDRGGHPDGHQLRPRRHGGERQRRRRHGHQCRCGQPDVADRERRARSSCSRWRPYGDGNDRRRNERSANLHDQSAAARFPTFTYTGGEQLFTVPAGVVSNPDRRSGRSGRQRERGGGSRRRRSMGGRTTATVSVLPGAFLTVRVGGSGPDGKSASTVGGFNGGGASAGNGGGGGGASSVRDGSIPLVIAGGGGGGGGSADILGGVGGAGGGLTAAAGGSAGPVGGGGGGGGTQAAGGGGGGGGTPVAPLAPPALRVRVEPVAPGRPTTPLRGGGGGGGGYFGGGGGGGGVGVSVTSWRRRRGRLVVRGAWRDRCRASARGQHPATVR